MTDLNTNTDRFATCDGRPLLLDWRINHHLFFTFEIDLAEAEKFVPEKLEIVEVRPNVALLSIGLLRYERGHFGPDSEEFHELVTAIHVAPDLSVKIPMPRMNFFAITVYSDSTGFVDGEARTIYTPTHYVPSLKIEFDADGMGAKVSDKDGPVCELRSNHPEPKYGHVEFWGHHYTNTKGLQHGIWEWDGSRFEHMTRNDDWTIHDHPFFVGLNVAKIRKLYRQMVHEPGTVCRERFYAVRPVE